MIFHQWVLESFSVGVVGLVAMPTDSSFQTFSLFFSHEHFCQKVFLQSPSNCWGIFLGSNRERRCFVYFTVADKRHHHSHTPALSSSGSVLACWIVGCHCFSNKSVEEAVWAPQLYLHSVSYSHVWPRPVFVTWDARAMQRKHWWQKFRDQMLAFKQNEGLHVWHRNPLHKLLWFMSAFWNHGCCSFLSQLVSLVV